MVIAHFGWITAARTAGFAKAAEALRSVARWFAEGPVAAGSRFESGPSFGFTRCPVHLSCSGRIGSAAKGPAWRPEVFASSVGVS